MTSAITTKFGAGGVGEQPGHGAPDLASALRDAADDLTDLGGVTAAWTTGVTVTTHVATLARAGVPVAVEATTASSTGVKQVQNSGSPAAGFVQVAFSSGVATLTFNATDAVTECAVLLNPAPAAQRLTKG